MGLDITFGAVCKPTKESIVFDTLNYTELEIFEGLALKVTKQVTNLKAIAQKLNYELPAKNWCYSDELQMNKKGLYFHRGLIAKGVKFDDLIESEKTFYEFSISEIHYASCWFTREDLKPKMDFPFIWQHQKAFDLIYSLKEDYQYLSQFLQNFEEGKHLIHLSY